MLTIAEARWAPRSLEAVMAARAPVGQGRPVIVNVATVGERGIVRGTTRWVIGDLSLARDEARNASRRHRCGEGDDWENEGEGTHVGRWSVSV